MAEKSYYHKRLRITEDEWKILWSDYRESGETQKRFCEHRKINLFNFKFWRKLYGNPEQPKEEPDGSRLTPREEVNFNSEGAVYFTPAMIKASGVKGDSGITVYLPGDVRIAIGQGANQAALQLLFQFLRERRC